MEPPWGIIGPRALDLGPHEAAVAALLAVLVFAVATRAFQRVGFTPVDTALILVAAPLLAARDVVITETGGTLIALNFAGFIIPAAIAAKAVAQRRVPWGATLFTVAVVTVTAYFSSYAVPSEGVLLYYRIPAVTAGALAVVLRWGRWTQAGLVAYISGAVGVIVGADAFHLHKLIYPTEGVHKVILGGAGVFDGIFLVALLAAALTFVARGVAVTLDVANGAGASKGARGGAPRTA